MHVLGRVAFETAEGKAALAVVLKIRRSELMPTEDEFNKIVAESNNLKPRSREHVQILRPADFTIRIDQDPTTARSLVGEKGDRIVSQVFGWMTQVRGGAFEPREWYLVAVGFEGLAPATGMAVSIQHRSSPALSVPVTKGELPKNPDWYFEMPKIDIPKIPPINIPPVKINLPPIGVPQIKVPNPTVPGMAPRGTPSQSKKPTNGRGKTSGDAKGKPKT